MLGINYIKFDSMNYVIHYKGGKIKKEGRGLSFFYFSLNSSIVSIPVQSNDFQFVFNESPVYNDVSKVFEWQCALFYMSHPSPSQSINNI